MLKIKKVAVGISGGVDSAVTALLLKQKNFEVQGVFMQNWDIRDEQGHCSSDEDYQDASYVCDKLGIKLVRVSFVKQYWNEVFCNLVKEYQSGYTPNPDILCNRTIKFNYFYDYCINVLRSDAIATGHYAKTNFGPYLDKYNPDIGVRLYLTRDSKKDQSFFLSQVRQRALRRTMFPLGSMRKTEVKAMAREHGLERIARKKESMGICFIGLRKFQDFIKEYIEDKPGDFVNVDTGQVIGHHLGLHQWTLGQRTCLGGYASAYFTVKKNPEDNVIYVAPGTKHPTLYSNVVFTGPPHWIHSRPAGLEDGNVFECNFKFQHTQPWIRCEVSEVPDKGLVVKLEKCKRAVTPGQYAVFAKGEEFLGGAKICNEGVSHFTAFYLENSGVVERSEIRGLYEQVV